MTLFPGVALITGAASGKSHLVHLFSIEGHKSNLSQGIGRATAVSFALEGCQRIAICDRNLEGLIETEKCMKEVSSYAEVLKIQVDMLEEEQIEMMVHETGELLVENIPIWCYVHLLLRSLPTYLQSKLTPRQ